MKGLRIGLVAIVLVMGMAGLAHAQYFMNSGFEMGDFSYWSMQIPLGASASVVTTHTGDLGAIYNPMSGSYFALLKTDGPGSYTYARQSAYLAAGTTISGWAALDWRDYNPFFDTAEVNILDSSGNLVANAWSEDGSGNPDYWDGPWTAWSWTAASAGTFTLEYRITNALDSILDSYAMFDSDMTDVPEPSTLLLLVGAGLVGAAGFWRKRRSG